MPRYIVTALQRTVVRYYIEAASPEEAVEFYREGSDQAVAKVGDYFDEVEPHLKLDDGKDTPLPWPEEEDPQCDEDLTPRVGRSVPTVHVYASEADGVCVVDIDTSGMAENEKGPILRVNINDGEVYENPPYPVASTPGPTTEDVRVEALEAVMQVIEDTYDHDEESGQRTNGDNPTPLHDTVAALCDVEGQVSEALAALGRPWFEGLTDDEATADCAPDAGEPKWYVVSDENGPAIVDEVLDPNDTLLFGPGPKADAESALALLVMNRDLAAARAERDLPVGPQD